MNTKQLITRTAVTFAALTIAGISVAVSLTGYTSSVCTDSHGRRWQRYFRRRINLLPDTHVCFD
jgi:hypothetical protein